MDTAQIEELKGRIETFKKNHRFAVEKKLVGKKEFETYQVAETDYNKVLGNYIRVTHPLSYWVPPAFKAWLQGNTQKSADKKMEDAGQVGSLIHTYAEKFWSTIPSDEYVQTLQIPEASKVQVKNGCDAFNTFWKDCGLTILAQELQVFSPSYGFAGTIDMVAEKDGQIYVIDWKSGWYKPTYGWQLAAYGLAFKELFGVQPKLMAVMLDKRSGKASKIEYEHNSHLEACYLGVLQAFAGENWKALGEFWPWSLNEFHQINRTGMVTIPAGTPVEVVKEEETQLSF